MVITGTEQVIRNRPLLAPNIVVKFDHYSRWKSKANWALFYKSQVLMQVSRMMWPLAKGRLEGTVEYPSTGSCPMIKSYSNLPKKILAEESEIHCI